MTQDQRATFAKVEFANGDQAKIVYSFRLERIHWIFAILASLAAVAVALVVLRGAVYASVQDVAGDEFRTQLEQFHAEAKPAIRRLIDERIASSHALHLAERSTEARDEALAHARELAGIAETLGRLDERLASIERRLDRMETNR